MPHRVLSRGLWIVAEVLLGIVVLLIVAVTAALLVGRTGWGRHKILSIALPRVQRSLTGQLRVGGLEGNLTHMLALRDVELTDAEGQPAVRVRHVALSYNLLELPLRRLHLTTVDAQGVWVRARPLSDGRLNLAALARPSDKPSGPPPNITIRLDKVRVEGAAYYEPPDRRMPPAALRLQLEAGARIQPARGVTEVSLHGLALDTSMPVHATMQAQGAFAIQGAAMEAHGVKLALQVQGEELGRLAPAARLQGPFALELSADGPLGWLPVRLVLRPPQGQLEVQGRVGATAPDLPWELSVKARDIDPGAARWDLPHARIGLDARGSGRGPEGEVELRDLNADALHAYLRAQGRVVLPALDGNLSLDLDARDLGQLERVGAPPLRGTVRLTARVARTGAELRVDAEALVARLRAAGVRVGRAELRAHTINFGGRVELDVSDIYTRQLQLNTAALRAEGHRKRVALQLAARGPQGLALQTALSGDLHYRNADPQRLAAADVVLERLLMARNGERWQTAGPARVHLGSFASLTGLVLTSGGQSLNLQEARFAPAQRALAARLEARGLDLKRIARLVPVRTQLPQTDLNLSLRASGTTRAPDAAARLWGTVERLPAISLPPVRGQVDVRYAGARVRGGLDVQSLDARPRLSGRFDVPLAPSAPLQVALDGDLPLPLLRRFLPPELKAIEGTIQLQVRAAGSAERPEGVVQLRVPKWRTATLDGRSLSLDLDYRAERLGLRMQAGARDTEGHDLGALDATVSAPVRLGAGVGGARLTRELMRAPVSGNVQLRKVDVGGLSLALLAQAPPVTAGIVDARLDLGGTIEGPVLHLAAGARGLATEAIDRVDLDLGVDYRRDTARVDLGAGLRGAPILKAHAEAPLPMRQVLHGHGPWWRTLPLRLDATVPSYDLHRLSADAAGTLEGGATVRGTAGAPVADLKLTGKKMVYQEWQVGDLLVQGAFRDARATAQVRGSEAKGGQLRLDAEVPMDSAQPLRLVLQAQRYVLDYQPRSQPKGALRVLRGTLDTDLHVEGPRRAPVPYGSLRLHDGSLAVAADPRLYRNVEVDVTMDRSGLLTLRQISTRAEVGRARVDGSVKLDGLRPARVDLKLGADQFPVAAGPMGLWVDASVAARGGTRNGVFNGTVTVDSALVRLPQIANGRKLQSTKPQEDVIFTDRQGRLEEARAAEQAAAPGKNKPPPLDQLPTAVAIDVRISNYINVRGKDINTSIEGGLKMEVKGGVPLISGTVRAPEGWVELLGRRYDIERAVISLDGSAEPDPDLDIRVSRKAPDALIVIEVSGTALQPKLSLRSEPPIYSESEVISMIINGDPTRGQAQPSSLDQKALGMVSGLLVGQIKDRLAEHLPIDVLKVDVGGPGYNVFGQTRVEVGKYLTDNLYMAYTHQFGSPVGLDQVNHNQVEMDYHFLRNFMLETIFGDAGIGSLDLHWLRRF